MPLPKIWHVPYQRNPFFTGREDVLSQLHNALPADAREALSHPLGISGLGWIGKTQTALESEQFQDGFLLSQPHVDAEHL